MQLNKQYSFLQLVATLFIAITISMPLFSNWFGSAITYLFYLLGIAAVTALNYGFRINFSKLDIPIIVFFTAYLFSIFYAVNPDFKTELLFMPLLFILYYGGKGIAKKNLTHLLLNYTSILFIFFSIYLLYQLSHVSFAYNAYYFYSNASNKVDYLTTAMYAGIVFIYAVFGIKNGWIKYPIAVYSLFVVAVSGARFSIFFLSLFLILLILIQTKHILFSYKSILTLFIASLVISFAVSNIDKKNLDQFKSTFDFTIMRLSNFNKHDRSLQERATAIDDSISAINEHPYLGYGINSSPKVIHIVYPHNMLLEAWLDTGLTGIVALISIVTLMLSILYFSIKDRSLLALGMINLYVILAHLKSFSILHSFLLFALAGLSVSALIYSKKQKQMENIQ
jgi:O-antigen ligase